MQNVKHKVIFDTDPGVDDAMALYFALAHPDIKVLGITTSFGNVTVAQATENALYLSAIAGRAIPVAGGVAVGVADGVAAAALAAATNTCASSSNSMANRHSRSNTGPLNKSRRIPLLPPPLSTPLLHCCVPREWHRVRMT